MSLKLTAMGDWSWAVVVVAAFVLIVVGYWLAAQIIRAALTIPARSPLPVLLRYLSRFVGPWHLTGDAFFAADGADEVWVRRRRAALEHLADRLERTFGESAAWGSALRDSFSDLRFTDLSRVPFQFAREMRARFNVFSAVTESRGPWLKDAGG